MALANYTTTVAAEDSLAEIEKMLAQFGASSISKQYEGGKAVGIEFIVKLDGYPLEFRLPINPSAAQKVMAHQKVRAHQRTAAHAERVSWRILRDWVRAQLAMVELRQAELAQVFMPYAMLAGESAYQGFRIERTKQLTAGGEDGAAQK